jgi:hypothetical protein
MGHGRFVDSPRENLVLVLLGSEGADGIDGGGVARGDERGRSGADAEDQDGAKERKRIVIAKAVEHAGHHPAGEERSGNPQRKANEKLTLRATQHDGNHR